MRTLFKWAGITVAVLAAVGFMVFLYNIPPFFLQSPEQFGAAVREAAPAVDHVSDPAQRIIAERGRQIVMNTGCIGCHAVNGPQGPDYSRYLGGGAVKITSTRGTFVSRNLTPDPETGLARRTDDEVKRVLRSGTFPDGHVVPYTAMPWANFSNWTEEDRHAVLIYLRNLKPVKHAIPEPVLEPADLPPGVVERDFGAVDYGIN
jgi:mono/diheme cytochrome c family protein